MAIVRFFRLNAQGVKNMKSSDRHEMKGVSVLAALKWAHDSLAQSPEAQNEIIEAVITDDSISKG